MANENKSTTAIYTAYDEFRPTDPAAPERNLLRAVLMTALSDLRKPGESKERARQYLMSEEEDYIFSFRAICSYLNVDANRVLMINGLEFSIDEPLADGKLKQEKGCVKSA